jgi:hypothetical protein
MIAFSFGLRAGARLCPGPELIRRAYREYLELFRSLEKPSLAGLPFFIALAIWRRRKPLGRGHRQARTRSPRRQARVASSPVPQTLLVAAAEVMTSSLLRA